MQRYHFIIVIYGVRFGGDFFFSLPPLHMQSTKPKQAHSLDFSVGPPKYALICFSYLPSCERPVGEEHARL